MLDEMYHPRVAEELVKRGHEVVAVAAEPERVGLPDEQVLMHATSEGYALVTENVRDCEVLRMQWLKEGRNCAGLIYTHRQRFPRDKRWMGRLVTALDERMSSNTVPAPGEVEWLT
ncbi:MAG: DUF5615 family PIN-like protein [Haloechinothrix sp.]